MTNDGLTKKELDSVLGVYADTLGQFDLGRDALRMARELAERRANDALAIELLEALYDQAGHIGLVVTMVSWKLQVGSPTAPHPDGTERERGRRLYEALTTFEQAMGWSHPVLP